MYCAGWDFHAHKEQTLQRAEVGVALAAAKKSHDQTGNAAHTSLKGIMSAKDKQWAKKF